jgi:hypothetical protein
MFVMNFYTQNVPKVCWKNIFSQQNLRDDVQENHIVKLREPGSPVPALFHKEEKINHLTTLTLSLTGKTYLTPALRLSVDYTTIDVFVSLGFVLFHFSIDRSRREC